MRCAMPENVKCIECGCLGLRKWVTREIVEVEDEIRDTGDIPVSTDPKTPNQPLYDPPLICIAKAYPLFIQLGRTAPR